MPQPPLPSEFLVTTDEVEIGGGPCPCGRGGDRAAEASSSDDRADYNDEVCGELRTIIAQLWRLGYVLLTHAGRCLLHTKLKTVRLEQVAAAPGCAGASHLESFNELVMRLPPQGPIVTACICDCFELFNARKHVDLANNVFACVHLY